MEVITTITARDYSNLKQVYSEKNIVNSTSGNEYIIETSNATNVPNIDGTPVNVQIPELKEGDTALAWASKAVGLTSATSGTKLYLREEFNTYLDDIVIETDKIIENINSISIKLRISYDKYVNNAFLVNDSNRAGNITVFSGLISEEYKENKDGYLIAENALPFEHGVAKGTLSGDVTASSSFPPNNWSITSNKLSNGNYQIVITPRIVTWWGKNNSEYKAFGGGATDTNTLLVARVLNFTITANTVTERQVEFNYKRELSAFESTQGKNYPINGNEFLQTENEAEIEDKQSYILSQEIFSKFDTDRTILSFLLLNCEKYWVDGEQRYLQAEDLIYIQDENDQYIGTETTSEGEIPGIFEVIKTRPIWDGTFTMEVTCRRIDMTQ